MGPDSIWLLSTRLYRSGWRRTAYVLKLVNYVAFKAVLPIECKLADRVTLYHRGLAVVVHPRTTIGRGVTLAHGVTLGCAGDPTRCQIIIEDDVIVGAGAVVIASEGAPLVIGRNSLIGANTTILESVPEVVTAVPPTPSLQPRRRELRRGGM